MFLVLASLLLKMKQVNLYNTLSGYAKHIDVASQVFQISVAVLYSICSVLGMLMVGYWAQPSTTWFFTDQEYVKNIWYRLSVIGEQIWSNTNCTSLTKSMQTVRYENVTIDTTLPTIFTNTVTKPHTKTEYIIVLPQQILIATLQLPRH